MTGEAPPDLTPLAPTPAFRAAVADLLDRLRAGEDVSLRAATDDLWSAVVEVHPPLPREAP